MSSSSSSQLHAHVQRVLQHRDNYYDILGVPRDADAAAVRRSYYKIALHLHPDKNPHHTATAAEAFRLVHEAYSVLSDTRRRAVYDVLGAQSARDYDALADMHLDVRAIVVTVASMLALLLLHTAARRAVAAELQPRLLAAWVGEGNAEKLSSTLFAGAATTVAHAMRHARARADARRMARRTLLLVVALVAVVALVTTPPARPHDDSGSNNDHGDDDAVLRRRGHGWFVRARPFDYRLDCAAARDDDRTDGGSSGRSHTWRVLRFGGNDTVARAAFARFVARRCDEEADLLSASRQRYAATATPSQTSVADTTTSSTTAVLYNVYNNDDDNNTAAAMPRRTLRRRYAVKTWPRRRRLRDAAGATTTTTYTVQRAADLYSPSSLCRAYWSCRRTTHTLVARKVAALHARLAVPSSRTSMAGVVIWFVFTNSVATSIWMFNAWSPFIYTLFDGSNVYVGLMSAINGVFELSVAFVSGHVADRLWGPSRMLRIAVCFGLATMAMVLIAAWSDKAALLMLAQAFEGTYMGLSFTNVESVFAQCLRSGERDRLYSVKFSLEAAGPMVGVVLSIVLYAVVGNTWQVSVLRWVITCGLLLHIASIVAFLARFKPLPHETRARAQAAAAVDDGNDVDVAAAHGVTAAPQTRHKADDVAIVAVDDNHDNKKADNGADGRRCCGAMTSSCAACACEDDRVAVDEALPSTATTTTTDATVSELANRARTAMLSERGGGATMAMCALTGVYNPSVCSVAPPPPMAVDEAVAAAAVASATTAAAATATATTAWQRHDAYASSADSDSDTHKTHDDNDNNNDDKTTKATNNGNNNSSTDDDATTAARVLRSSFYSVTQFGGSGGVYTTSNNAAAVVVTTSTAAAASATAAVDMAATVASRALLPQPQHEQQHQQSTTTPPPAASTYIVGYVDTELQKARGLRRRVLASVPLTSYPLLIIIADLVLVIGSGMTTQYMSLFMMKVYGVSPIVLALLNLSTSLLISVLAIVNGYVGQRWGRVRAMLPTKLLGCALLLWMALGNKAARRPHVLMCIAFVLRNACMNCSAGLSRALIMDIVPAHRRGRWNAVESVQSAGWSGTAFIGGFIADRYSYGASFIFTFAFHLAACVLLLPMALRNDSRLPQPIYATATTTNTTTTVAVGHAAPDKHDHDETTTTTAAVADASAMRSRTP